MQQLSDLVTDEAFKVVLRHFYDRAEGKSNAFAISIAKTLIDVARFHVGIPPDHLAELKRLAGSRPPQDLCRQNDHRANSLFVLQSGMFQVAPTKEEGWH